MLLSCLGLWLLPSVGQSQEAVQEQVLANFFPYREGFPKMGDIRPGMTIDSPNAEMWARSGIVNSSGAVERTQTFFFFSMYGMHRADPDKNISQWERQGVYSKQYTMMLALSDMEGFQILSATHDKDGIPNDQWAYDPQTRRTRKIVHNPYISPERGVLLIEDRGGFLGYIHAYDWKYIREQTVLVPGPIRAAEPTWGGKGNWYFVDPWELRRAVVVEATPETSHPLYSRRVLYMDLQSSMPLYAFVYDHDGNHKRTFLLVARHPDFDPWDNKEWFARLAAQASI